EEAMHVSHAASKRSGDPVGPEYRGDPQMTVTIDMFLTFFEIPETRDPIIGWLQEFRVGGGGGGGVAAIHKVILQYLPFWLCCLVRSEHCDEDEWIYRLRILKPGETPETDPDVGSATVALAIAARPKWYTEQSEAERHAVSAVYRWEHKPSIFQ